MSNNYYSDYQSDKIVVNGVTMTLADYKKIKSSTKKPKRKKKTLDEIKILPEDIKYLTRDFKVINSLIAFYNNGYKQWGNIHRLLMNVDDMNHDFMLLKNISSDFKSKLNEISSSAKRSYKSTYGLINDLAFITVEMGQRLTKLYNTIHNSNIINSPFNSHEIINGNGRRLGLKILLSRTDIALNNMLFIINKLHNMSIIPDSYYDNKTKFIDTKLNGV